MKRKTLNEIYSEWFVTVGVNPGAIFKDMIHSLKQGQSLPWGDGEDVAHVLDMEYIGNISGDKNISPLFEKLIANYPQNQIMNVRYLISDTILMMFLDKWQKAWNTLEFEYDPIENYSMLETMTGDTRSRYYGKTSTRTDNLNSRNAGTNRSDSNLTDVESVNTFGFNSTSVDGEPNEKRTTTRTGSNVDTVDVSKIDTGTQSFADGGSDREEHSYTLTRTGNIGTVTAQDMIKQEREIVLWDYFFEVVFPDINRVLTLKIY